jgi:hypothetical protein
MTIPEILFNDATINAAINHNATILTPTDPQTGKLDFARQHYDALFGQGCLRDRPNVYRYSVTVDREGRLTITGLDSAVAKDVIMLVARHAWALRHERAQDT